MNYQLIVVIMGICLVGSAFFSGSETAVTAVNRYRLQYLANIKKQASAQILLRLLQCPQKLLSMILIANTFLNVLISSLATALALIWLGQKYVLLVTFMLTIVILICAEVVPKSIAAYYSDYIAYAVAPVLKVLLVLLGPIVFIIDKITSFLLKCCGVSLSGQRNLDLSRDELGSLIKQRVRAQKNNEVEYMLEGVLDLASITVEDIMCPRAKMKGVDISQPWHQIIKIIRDNEGECILFYKNSFDHILGTIDVQIILSCMLENKLNKETLLQHLTKPVYVPEMTSLEVQLKQFGVSNTRFSFVVDEYGQVTGVIESKYIIDQITGIYAKNYASGLSIVLREEAGQYWFDGNMPVRDINKILHWTLPEMQANTIGGLVVDYLECIPEGVCAVQIHGYRIEIITIVNNKISRLKIIPPSQEPEVGWSNKVL